MNKDRKILYSLSTILLAILSLVFFVPAAFGRIVAAIILIIFSFLICKLFKKRNILSINKRTVTIIVLVSSLLLVVLLYLSGAKFGFFKSNTPLSIDSTVKIIIPTIVLIISSEVIRHTFVSQESKYVNIVSFLLCFLVDVLICSNIREIQSFNNFMDLFGMVILPAFISNILYMYLVKRYGIYPNISYRSVTILFPYVIPVISGMPDALFSIVMFIAPLLLYLFIKSLYETKKSYKDIKMTKISYIIYGIILVLCVCFVAVISCQFKYCAIVIATDSMSGEINRGDLIIYESYDDQIISVGDVLVFDKGGSTIVHRVVEIKNINGQIQYYTKGDANKEVDEGFIISSNIIGCMNFKLSYLGYPTLLLRDIVE